MIDNIFLVNHRPPSHERLKSIMRLTEKEAFSLAAKLFEDKTCEANHRFGPDEFANYYQTRLKAEKWLHDNFVAFGGKPQTKHPLYFYVHGWDGVAKFWAENITERILLADIEPCDISFTFGDSCGAVDNPDMHHFFMKDELMELVSTYDSIENLLTHITQQIGYGMIETHLWNDQYITNMEE